MPNSHARKRPFPLFAGYLEVVATARLTPRTARLTLTAPEVAGFPDEEPGEVITLLWPQDGGVEVVLPTEGWRFAPGTPQQHARNFTIRLIDRARCEVVIDFALHDAPGRAIAWGERARPGSRVAFAGPRPHFVWDPAATWTLLCADETGLPAVAATLERLPAGHRAFAVLEVVDAGEQIPLPSAADAEVIWVHRGDDAPDVSRRIEEAVRALRPPPGPGNVWAGAEATVVRGLRDYWRDELGLPVGATQARGYWKHRRTRADVDDDILPPAAT